MKMVIVVQNQGNMNIAKLFMNPSVWWRRHEVRIPAPAHATNHKLSDMINVYAEQPR